MSSQAASSGFFTPPTLCCPAIETTVDRNLLIAALPRPPTSLNALVLTQCAKTPSLQAARRSLGNACNGLTQNDAFLDCPLTTGPGDAKKSKSSVACVPPQIGLKPSLRLMWRHTALRVRNYFARMEIWTIHDIYCYIDIICIFFYYGFVPCPIGFLARADTRY
jgi:hypothetical protein